MRKIIPLWIALVAVVALAGTSLGAFTAMAQSTPTVKSGQTSLGQVLTGPNGRTLYMFTKDTAGVSNCTGACLQNWPPLTVTAGETPSVDSGLSLTLGTLVRSDTGATQVTLGGIPLYYWAADQAPGQTGGQGVGGVWFALNTSGTAVPVAAPASTPTKAATTAPSAPATGTGPAGGGANWLGLLGIALLFASLALGGTTLAAIRRK
jgi:predicted lipoprotein with Yx(FWY)xxD motif